MSTDFERATELFSCDFAQGILRWRVSRSPRIKIGDVAGSINNEGYLRVWFDGRSVYVHRIIWLLAHGEWPTATIDHRNRNRSDNRLLNLREATRGENQHNQPTPKHNTSGVKGVSFAARERKWHAYVSTARKRTSVGYYPTLALAEIAAAQARALQHRAFANHGG